MGSHLGRCTPNTLPMTLLHVGCGAVSPDYVYSTPTLEDIAEASWFTLDDSDAGISIPDDPYAQPDREADTEYAPRQSRVTACVSPKEDAADTSPVASDADEAGDEGWKRTAEARTTPAFSLVGMYPTEFAHVDGLLARKNQRKMLPQGTRAGGRMQVIVVEDDGSKAKVPPEHTRVPPKRPAHQRATLVDTTLMDSTALHTAIQDNLNYAMDHGFIKWSNNMCHFDTHLLLNMVCYAHIGADYWVGPGGHTRGLSRTERWTCDLMCSYRTSTDEQMMHLRDVYMWSVLEESSTFGDYVDAMVHSYTALEENDMHHSVHRSFNRQFLVPCTCEGHPTTWTEGCLRVAVQMLHDDRTWEETDIESCIWHSLVSDTKVNIHCQSSVPGENGVRCKGKFRNTLARMTLGALLVVAIEVGFKPTLALRVKIGQHVYNLMGMALWGGSHYIAQFRTDAASNQWFVYDDNAKRTPDNPTRRCIIPVRKNPLANPAVHGGIQWCVRGLWFVNVLCGGKPFAFTPEFEFV